MPIQPDRGNRYGISWREVLTTLAPEKSTSPSPIEIIRLLMRHGRQNFARSACDELVAAQMLMPRDLLVLSDQCKSRGDLDHWAFYRRRAYEIEMFSLGLRDQKHAESVQYCLASDGVCDQHPSPPESYLRALFDQYSDTFEQRLIGELEYRGPQEVYRIVTSHRELKLSGARILDAGCGTGLAGPLFRPHATRLDGLDLSPAMIDRARERDVYAELIVGDVVNSIRNSNSHYDLVLAIDLLVYIGDLSVVFKAIASNLGAGGWVAASIEQGEAGYQHKDHRRYLHSLDYVRDVSMTAGLKMVCTEATSLRKERGKPVDFHVALFTMASVE
mgnify:CR=1 FL=1